MSYSDFSKNIQELRYSWDKSNGSKESWNDIADRVTKNVLSIVNIPEQIKDSINLAIQQRKFIPGGRFLAQSGRDYHQTSNCFLLRAEDSREAWGELLNKATVMLMSGGGLGIDYSDLRSSGSKLKRSGGTSSGPIPLMKIINEVGRGVMSGGKRRSAIWAGLRWSHQDIFEFIKLKDWPEYIKNQKEVDYDTPASMDMTNISVILDKDFFDAFDDISNPLHKHAQKVYWETVEKMVKTAEPGFSVDYQNKKESLRNACTEIVSEDDSDVCVLGSLNLANINSIDELKTLTDLAILFLLVGTEYTDRPTEKVKEIQEKNRRLGLGLMGIHEWLIKRGYKYDVNDELADWLENWKIQSDISAKKWATYFTWNIPIKTRALAPNGTISIVGGQTTSGIEPIFAVAYQRRYLTPDGWRLQFVIDSVAEKLIENGIAPENIEDAYSLSLDVERRIKFQVFVQKYVDNAISSTINLPQYGKLGNDDYITFGKMLYKYLPYLRGITCYPDMARGSAQPLQVVDYYYAKENKDTIFEINENSCIGGVCGV